MKNVKLISGLVSFVLSVGVLGFPVSAHATEEGKNPVETIRITEKNTEETASIVDSGKCGDNLKWTYDNNGVLKISGTGKMNDYLSLEYLDEMPPWYEYCDYITSIIIEKGVSYIGRYAFYFCQYVTEVTLPETVTEMGPGAFDSCHSLKNFTAKGKLTKISDISFQGCFSLEKVTFPDSVTRIEEFAFAGCESLESISNMRNVTFIGWNAFHDCLSLKQIVISGKMQTIENGAFDGCSNLTTVIYGSTFKNWKKLNLEGNEELNKAKKKYYWQEDVWGFDQGAGIGATEYYHHKNMFGSIQGRLLWSGDTNKFSNSKGYCAGMAISSSAIAVGGYPSKSSFIDSKGRKIATLHQVTSPDNYSSNAQISASELIKYAQIYQNMPEFTAEKKKNKNKYASIFKAVKTSVDKGEYDVVLSMSKGNKAHAVLAVDYSDNASRTIIFVYDGNDEATAHELTLNKKDGKYTSWSYSDYSSSKKCDLSYYQPGRKFSTWMKTNKQITSEKYLISYVPKAITVKAMDAVNQLTLDSADPVGFYRIIPEGTEETVEENLENMYWVDKTGEMVVSSDENLDFSIAGDDCLIKAVTPAKTDLIVNPEKDDTHVNVGKLKETDSYEIRYSFFDEDEITDIIISGKGTDSVRTSRADKDFSVESKGDISVIVVVNDVETDHKDLHASEAAIYFNVDSNDKIQIDDKKIESIAMYRLYNPNSWEHFYTGNEKEKDALVKMGWQYEGIGWYAPEESNTPVYRLYNPNNGGDHHYTKNKKEYDALVKAGWTGEGVRWFSDDKESVPVYREYNPGAPIRNHNYTANKKEHDALVKTYGWKDEGTGWYGTKQ